MADDLVILAQFVKLGMIDKGLVEYVDPDSKRRKEVRLTDLGYNVFEKLDIVCW